MLTVNLAAEKLIMLCNLRIDGEAVRVSERLANLSRLIVCDFRHNQTQLNEIQFIEKA